jgi:hypothetical protein
MCLNAISIFLACFSTDKAKRESFLRPLPTLPYLKEREEPRSEKWID